MSTAASVSLFVVLLTASLAPYAGVTNRFAQNMIVKRERLELRPTDG